MTKKSSSVISNQSGIHKDLEQIVKKHLSHPYKKPYREFSEDIFHQIDEIQKKTNKPIILVSGCGTGKTSI
ncbi:MAG: SAM-dependent methyltransferase, partial [Proteobacteria bacterium]|nr:SAM-dependent methyltransferase [Pseudomonadota bacterium]